MEAIEGKQLYTSLKWSILLTIGLNIIVILVQWIINISSSQIIFHLYVILSLAAFGLTLYATWYEHLNLLLISGFSLIVIFFLGAFAKYFGAIIIMFIVILAVFSFAYLVKKEHGDSTSPA
uniref:Uncharacterized protein n=1 Tax=Tetranychus urticae TaxID=32264 RepID=T1KDA2_TETUR